MSSTFLIAGFSLESVFSRPDVVGDVWSPFSRLVRPGGDMSGDMSPTRTEDGGKEGMR